ncbi:Rid family detoxifying hydrolase [Leptobacterium sp. I13]|uniref:Rid family detoxifying hydrolase n=1 Tax=Leptobacterium meishanense TaxID=3128904 RepID=UPI0030EEF3E9
MKSSILFLLILFLTGCTTENTQKNEIVFHPSHIEQRLKNPFSDAVEANGFLFLTGQIGFDYEEGALVEGGIQTETEQVIKNIEAVLEQHELTLDNVVKCTVILSDINDFAAFNSVYKQFFTKKPARTTFAASGLARNAKIEIDVIAKK